MLKTYKLECFYCGKEYNITVEEEQYKQWREGKEVSISSLCPKCQKIFYGEDENEESAND